MEKASKKFLKNLLTNKTKSVILYIQTKAKELTTMTTKCYFLDNSDACARAIDYITNTIPCFIREFFIDKKNITLTIECRDADLAFVERTLAPYV